MHLCVETSTNVCSNTILWLMALLRYMMDAVKSGVNITVGHRSISVHIA